MVICSLFFSCGVVYRGIAVQALLMGIFSIELPGHNTVLKLPLSWTFVMLIIRDIKEVS